MQTYPRPTERYVVVEREPVEGECPECGSSDLKAYPVLSEGGWWDVTKCQVCLNSVERVPGPLLGSIELLVETV
jgi:vanillate/4-hydroxybenzoate decarboxylase subunit D